MIADTGLLVALERNERPAWARFRIAVERFGPVLVPATVLAQGWRGGSGRQHELSVALLSVLVDDLDESTARQVGELLAQHHASDVADGHVALLANVDPRRPVATADRGDLENLGVEPTRILDI